MLTFLLFAGTGEASDNLRNSGAALAPGGRQFIAVDGIVSSA